MGNSPTTRYREVQRLRQWWIWAIIFLVTGVSWWAFLAQIVGKSRLPTRAQVAARPSTGPNQYGKRIGATSGIIPRIVVTAVIRIGRSRSVVPLITI